MANRTTVLVCNKCREDNPKWSSLLSQKCLDPGAHAKVPKVAVEWDRQRGNLKVIVRPTPRVYFRGGFVLCDGKRCIGWERCTFPHCKEEQQAWNEKKLGIPQSPVSRAIDTRVHVPYTAKNFPPTISPPPMRPRPPPGPPIPKLSASLDSRPTFADACAGRPQVPRSRHRSEPTSSEPDFGPPFVPTLETSLLWEESPWPDPVSDLGHQPAVSPVFSSPEPLAMPRKQKKSPPIPIRKATHSHDGASDLGPRNNTEAAPTRRNAPQQDPEDYAARKVKFYERVKERLHLVDIQRKLTRDNYKEKFNKLLCWEEKKHIDILGEKCNGRYTLVLHQVGLKTPTWMKFDAKPYHKRFGYITGLSGDQIAYATQASESAVIIHEPTRFEIKADILRENFHHTDNRLYLGFNEKNVWELGNRFSVKQAPFKKAGVCVEFEVKHFYFNGLHQSLESLRAATVARIMPEAGDFPQNGVKLQPLPRSTLDLSSSSPDQKHALQLVLSCPSKSPPLLISGPFGTGKTRILATMVHFLLQQSGVEQAPRPVRVLVCTQQQVSADTFLQCFFDILGLKDKEVIIARLITKYGYRKNELKRWYKTVQDFKRTFERSSRSNESDYLVVTTCGTSLFLAEFLHPGFFTHILLDEGAQMREPEGVAPLSMAGPNTKIVIAGDENQVGPAMLVLGKEARDNGLALSLLERLRKRYHGPELEQVAQQHCVTLVTNYRCHSGILRLAAELFYETPLQCWDQEKADSSAHPDALFPLRFVCSSVDDTISDIREATDEREARIVLQKAHEYAAKWPVEGWGPKDLTQMCFITPARSQVTVASGLMKRMPVKLNNIRKVPTYDIQGREYRAIFISTSEPTKKRGKTRNPTKSIADPYVFNTAITRARSLIVAVGNPFMLLRMEEHMVKRYEMRGRCWSTYLWHCLENGGLCIDPALELSHAKQEECLEKLQKMVKQRLSVKLQHHEPAADLPPLAPEPSAPVNDSATEPSTEDSTDASSVQSSSPPPKSKMSSHQEELQGDEVQLSSSPPNSTMSGHQELELQDDEPLGRDAFFDSKFEHEFKLLEQLGKGGFGSVYRVRSRSDNDYYAIKIIKLPNDIKEQKKVKREVQAFRRFKGHPRIVHYHQSWTAKAPRDMKVLESLRSSDSLAISSSVSAHSATVLQDPSSATSPSSATTPSYSAEDSVGESQAESSNTDSFVTFKDDPESSEPSAHASVHAQERLPVTPRKTLNLSNRPTCLFIQIELCKQDTLKDWLNKHRDIHQRKRKEVFDYFIQILEAVTYIHQKRMIHRDLKPSNIFFSRDNNSVKVGDFGLVAGNLTSDLSGGRQPKSRSSRAGTALYMAPEQVDGKKYDEKVDIFALGVILFELNYPFGTEAERQEVLPEIKSQNIPSPFQDKLPLEAGIVEWLLAHEPSHRPSAEEIMASDQLRRLKKAVKKAKDGYVPKL